MVEELKAGKTQEGFPKGHANKLPLENESEESYVCQVLPASVVTLKTLMADDTWCPQQLEGRSGLAHGR
jgi:hypothetical protein